MQEYPKLPEAAEADLEHHIKRLSGGLYEQVRILSLAAPDQTCMEALSGWQYRTRLQTHRKGEREIPGIAECRYEGFISSLSALRSILGQPLRPADPHYPILGALPDGPEVQVDPCKCHELPMQYWEVCRDFITRCYDWEGQFVQNHKLVRLLAKKKPVIFTDQQWAKVIHSLTKP